MRSDIKYMMLFLFACSTQSCKKILEVDPPIDRLNANVVFNNDENATSTVLGLYSKMMVATPVISTGAVTLYTGLSADEFFITDISDANLGEFRDNALTGSNPELFNDFWLRGYNIIYHTNACIAGLENNLNVSKSLKDQLLGESIFVRAFIYYYLVSLYGDVPLLINTDYKENGKASRTPVTEIYAHIITDLKTAKELLSGSYPTSGRVRPNKWTAAALLSRIYLNLGDWDLAERETSAIINSGIYSLESSLNDVFLAGSNEAIWQLMSVATGFNTLEGKIFVPATSPTSIPKYPLTSYLLNDFEPGDLRKDDWVGLKTVEGQAYYFPYKYKIWDFSLPETEYYMIFRLAEQYLIRTECYAHQGKLIEAKNDLNIIRNRAGLPDTPANNPDELLSAIANERRIELFAEWGHRWLDLKRTKRSSEVLSPIKPGWQATDTLYPIPSGEILKNPSLKQNPGY